MGEAIRPQLPALQEFRAHLVSNGLLYREIENEIKVSFDERSNVIQREGWNRLSAAPFAAIVLIFETVKQAIRAVLMFITGILTLDEQRLKLGFEDVIALPVQAVAMPFLIALAVLHPETSLKCTLELDRALGRDKVVLKNQTNSHKYFPSVACSTFFSYLFAPLTLTLDAVERLTLMPFALKFTERDEEVQRRFNYEESDVHEPILNLDAMKSLGTTLMSCGFKNVDKEDQRRSFVVRHIWSRIIAIPCGVIALIFKVVQQAIRGVLMLASGVLTFDWDRIAFGGRDFISIAIQTVAVPLLVLVALFWPKGALVLIDVALETGEDSLEGDRFKGVQLANQEGDDKHVVAQAACTTMTNVVAPLATPIQAVEDLLLNLLSLNWKSYPHTKEAFRYT